jgi:DMSO/TMAO reductase YedYZ molybdopterin-dependent catalytic subunit
MVSRRIFLAAAGTSLVLTQRAAGILAAKMELADGIPSGAAAAARLETLPGKVPLIKLTYRPPNYETPFSYFDTPITLNNAFFVRYHLADIPEVAAAEWRLRVGGAATGSPFELSLDELKRGFEPVEVVAVCQCSGNRRGLSQPHVQGVQWGMGAMGNARWKGARLKDVLGKAGVKKEAIEVAFNGADAPVIEQTPDFAKSIPLWKALEEDALVAYEMGSVSARASKYRLC